MARRREIPGTAAPPDEHALPAYGLHNRNFIAVVNIDHEDHAVAFAGTDEYTVFALMGSDMEIIAVRDTL